jgi:hypothetical protein
LSNTEGGRASRLATFHVGSGIFIVLALLIGIPGTAFYLLARIGDRKTS